MRTKHYLTIIISLIFFNASAQDIIIKINGDEINAKILNVGVKTIEYKRADNPDGPEYVINKADVFMIKYSDGSKTIFNSQTESPKTEIKTEEVKIDTRHCISAGYGWGISNRWLYGYDSYIDYPSSSSVDQSYTGPFFLKYEYRMTKEWGIGLNVAYLHYHSEWQDMMYDYSTGTYNSFSEKEDYSTYSILIRANWHFTDNDKIDPYYGFAVGYRTGKLTFDNSGYPYSYYYNYNYNYTNSFGTTFGFETTIGIRVKFSKHFGMYAEGGLAKAAIQVGFIGQF